MSVVNALAKTQIQEPLGEMKGRTGEMLSAVRRYIDMLEYLKHKYSEGSLDELYKEAVRTYAQISVLRSMTINRWLSG